MEILTRRHYADKVDSWIGKGNIIVLAGPRRVGQSYILKDFIERHSKEEAINVISVDKEKKAFGNLFQPGKHNCILVDEVQQIEKLEESICNWHTEDNTDVIITGSNSKMLSGDLSTLLAGRYVEIRVHPLTYPEFLEFQGIQDSDEHVWAYLSSVLLSLVHFWCNFLGIEKAYKIETQLLVGFIQRRVRDKDYY